MSSNETEDRLTRRAAVARVTALLGGAALVGQAGLLAACASAPDGRAPAEPLSEADVALLDEIAETILPETSTPGAKAAGVGAFMAVMARDGYRAEEQRIFREGLVALDRECRAMHGASFMAAAPDQRLALLERLDREQFEYMNNRTPDAPPHYFRMMKELALLGYFTSEIGYTQAQRYVETPGRFEPCTPYAPGDKAWAPHA